ncbi:MAG: hypothetical protein J3Q66DRAFT_431553 [Benniella sp.]|nr:MAG: hypothetical protein J3Q66DRAFT_431553 [Benniella sp.]
MKKWIDAFVSTGLAMEQAESNASAANSAVTKQEEIVQLLREDRIEAEDLQRSAARVVSAQKQKQEEPADMGHAYYMNLVEARQKNRMIARTLLPEEAKLEQLKRQRYTFNKLVQAGKTVGASTSEQSSRKGLERVSTTPSWEHRQTEELVQHLDISLVCQQAVLWSQKMITFSGTDYGLVIMSETVPVSARRIQAHLSELINSSTSKKDAVGILRIPSSFKITARLINNAFTKNFMNARLQLLKQYQHQPARLALGTLSTAGTLMHHARTVNDVRKAQTTRRTAREPLRQFETSRTLVKMRQTKDLRSKRAIRSLAAAERRYVLSRANDLDLEQVTLFPMVSATGWCANCGTYHFVNAQEAGFFRTATECPTSPVMLIGNAGTCVGSRLKGHTRRGGRMFQTG